MKEKTTKEKPSRSNDKLNMKEPLKCWICEEPHIVKNFPSKLKVAVVAQATMKKKKEELFVGVMQILGAAVATEVVS